MTIDYKKKYLKYKIKYLTAKKIYGAGTDKTVSTSENNDPCDFLKEDLEKKFKKEKQLLEADWNTLQFYKNLSDHDKEEEGANYQTELNKLETRWFESKNKLTKINKEYRRAKEEIEQEYNICSRFNEENNKDPNPEYEDYKKKKKYLQLMELKNNYKIYENSIEKVNQTISELSPDEQATINHPIFKYQIDYQVERQLSNYGDENFDLKNTASPYLRMLRNIIDLIKKALKIKMFKEAIFDYLNKQLYISLQNKNNEEKEKILIFMRDILNKQPDLDKLWNSGIIDRTIISKVFKGFPEQWKLDENGIWVRID